MMFAQPQIENISWDYLQRFATERYYWLKKLNEISGNTLQLAIRDPETNIWSKWKGWYSGSKWNDRTFTTEQLFNAYDIHRSMLPNEIVIESDYKTYEENAEASRFIGVLLEEKGWKSHYYYSGSKSVHISLYFDFKCLLELPLTLQNELFEEFRYKQLFIKKFIEYMRKEIISFF